MERRARQAAEKQASLARRRQKREAEDSEGALVATRPSKSARTTRSGETAASSSRQTAPELDSAVPSSGESGTVYSIEMPLLGPFEDLLTTVGGSATRLKAAQADLLAVRSRLESSLGDVTEVVASYEVIIDGLLTKYAETIGESSGKRDPEDWEEESVQVEGSEEEE